MRSKILISITLFFHCSFVGADSLNISEISDVMVGRSSAFNDGTWLRVSGLVGHESCQYAPQNVTLFYAKNDGPLSADKALSVLMAAKLSKSTIKIEYLNSQTTADFWGWGISSCELQRISIQ